MLKFPPPLDLTKYPNMAVKPKAGDNWLVQFEPVKAGDTVTMVDVREVTAHTIVAVLPTMSTKRRMFRDISFIERVTR